MFLILSKAASLLNDSGRSSVDLLDARVGAASGFKLLIHGLPLTDHSMLGTPPFDPPTHDSQVILLMVASRAIVLIVKLSRRAGRVCTSAHAQQLGAQ